MRDIVVPKNNEQDVVALAHTLGFTELWCVYDDPNKAADIPTTSVKIVRVQSATKPVKGITLAIATPENIRHLVEHVRPTFVTCVEELPRRDYLHQRASGLNHILCKLAHDNNVGIAFSFATLLSAQGSRRAELLGRISQNIVLCRKYHVRTLIGSFAKSPLDMRSPHDLSSLFVTLGMHPADVKKSWGGAE